MAKELGDRELIDKYKLKGKTLEMAMKDHLDKNDFLVRLKEREKLFKDNESLSNTRKWMEADFKKRYNNFNDKLTDKITEKQFKDLTSHNLNRIKQVMSENKEISKRLKLKNNKQNEHIFGTEEYNNRNDGQSYFKDTTESEIYNYMLKNMDMKKIYQKYQFINTDGINGVHILPSGQNINSNQIKMHQSKGGIHGVPNAKKEVNVMVKAANFDTWENREKIIKLYMRDGSIETGVFLGFDPIEDNDEGDGFILDVDGDTTVGRLITEDRLERVEFL